jgi:hypothetical protein
VADENKFTVVAADSLLWPESLTIPSARFRLFVAADTDTLSVDQISTFAAAALSRGMVYLCAWGAGCGRFHDVVDETLVGDEVLGENGFAPPTPNDTVMTTWHERDSLEEALDFFATCAYPSDGYADGSDYRVVICVGHPQWALTARDFLKSAPFFV